MGEFIGNIHIIAAEGNPFSIAGLLDASVFQSFLEDPLAEVFKQVKFESSLENLAEQTGLLSFNAFIEAARGKEGQPVKFKK